MKERITNHDEETLLRLRLIGENARPGQIPSRDVAELLRGAERVLAKAAGHVRGRQVRRTGRWEAAVESAVRLRFVGVEEGSFVAVLAPPPAAPTPLGLTAETLTQAAVREVAVQIGGRADREFRDVALAAVKWSDALGIGERYESVALVSAVPDAEAVSLDRITTERLRTVARIEPVLRQNEVIGRLVEADFERRTAHLRAATGDRVEVTFDSVWDDEIQQALRQETSVVGDVIYDPAAQRAVAVHLRELTRGEQLTAGLEPGPSATLSIQEIARQSGVGPVEDPSALYLDSIEDTELGEFLEAVVHAG